jgi:hypothetical protein
MIRILTSRGHNGKNVIKVVAPNIGHVQDFGFHVKQSSRTISLITYDIQPRVKHAQVCCNMYVCISFPFLQYAAV